MITFATLSANVDKIGTVLAERPPLGLDLLRHHQCLLLRLMSDLFAGVVQQPSIANDDY